MIHLLTPCPNGDPQNPCGGYWDHPRSGCERCELLQLAVELLRELYLRRSRSVSAEIEAELLACGFDLPLADVRRILGLDTPTEEAMCH